MELAVTPAVEWKLERAVEVMLGPGTDAAEYSFDERLAVFVEHWEETIASGGGWSDRAADADPEEVAIPGVEDRENRETPEFDREPVEHAVEPRHARRVEAIAAAEHPGRQVGEESFNDALEAALEAWNAYAAAAGAGWVAPGDHPFDY